jgi:colanic acid/amylovoran biosynthesis protein
MEAFMTSQDRRLSIGLLWHSLRCFNLGNGALTLSHIRILNQAAKAAKRPISIRVMEDGGELRYPPTDDNVTEEALEEAHKRILPNTQLWRAISDCDIVFDVGNGDLFSDLYGLDYFFLVTGQRIAALAQNVPLVLSPQTIGPFRQPHLKSLAGELSRQCEKVFARDAESLLLLNELGVTGAQQCVDVAFRLPFEHREPTPRRRIHFGFNVSGLLYDDATSKQFGFGLKADYPTVVRKLIATIKKRADISLILVPHVVGPAANSDVTVCRQLAREFDLQMAPEFNSPIEAKSFIARLDVLVASRMHATIAAVSSGVPVVPLAYSRKFSGVLRSVDYPLVGDLLSEDLDDVIQSVEHALTRLDELRAAAENSNAVAQRKLDEYQAYLTELLIAPPQGRSVQTSRSAFSGDPSRSQTLNG